MKILVLILLALLGAVLLGAVADSSSGYMVITLSDWIIGASMTFSITLLLIFFILFYLLLRSINKIIALPEGLRKWRSYRHQHKAERYLTQGLASMTEGRWKQAENEFLNSAKYGRSPQVNYLLAARAAQEQALLNKRDEYLRLARRANFNTALTVGITRAELQLHCRQNEQALATLRELFAKQPKQARVVRLLVDACRRLGAWDLMLPVLAQAGKTQSLDKENILARQLDAYAGLLIAAGNKGDGKELTRVWYAIPSKLRKQVSLIDAYVTQRLRLGDAADCDELLLSTLKHDWDRALVRLYGLIATNNSAAQLARMERFIKSHAHDPVLLLTLGRLSIKNKLWGKAKNYFEASIAIELNPETCYELATLYDREENKEAAIKYYHMGLGLAANIPEPPENKQAVE